MDSFENIWRARYDRWASQHTADHLVAGWSEVGLSRRLSLVLRALADENISKGSLILDLGAGPGTYSRSLKQLGYRCVGLDYSPKVIRIAKQKDFSGVYLQGEAYQLPFREGAFDAIVCIGVLQSLACIDGAIEEMHRVLAPGGFLLLDGLNASFWLHGVRSVHEVACGLPSRIRYYHPFSVTKLLDARGFAASRLNWLAVPECFQRLFSPRVGNRSRLLSFLFGHAFLIVAQSSQTQL